MSEMRRRTYADSSCLKLRSTHQFSGRKDTLWQVLVCTHLTPPPRILVGPDQGRKGSKALYIKSFIKVGTFISV